jgi:hypothetical protein
MLKISLKPVGLHIRINFSLDQLADTGFKSTRKSASGQSSPFSCFSCLANTCFAEFKEKIGSIASFAFSLRFEQGRRRRRRRPYLDEANASKLESDNRKLRRRHQTLLAQSNWFKPTSGRTGTTAHSNRPSVPARPFVRSLFIRKKSPPKSLFHSPIALFLFSLVAFLRFDRRPIMRFSNVRLVPHHQHDLQRHTHLSSDRT